MTAFTSNRPLFIHISEFIFLLSLSMLLTFGCASNTQLTDSRIPPEATPHAHQAFDLKRLAAVADSVAGAHIAAAVTPGMSVAVAKGDVLVFSRGWGKADVEQEVAASQQTVYMIGSVTKQITAAAIMRLVEAGKISLEDPITMYLPDYPVQGQQVNIRHLLNHTSGIKGFRVLHEENRQRFRLDLSYQEMVELFGKQAFEFSPGEKFEYNNMGYYLLGKIIGLVAGMPYEDYVERELLEPLGIKHTRYCENKRIIPRRAKGYEHEGDTLVNARYLSMQVGGAAGALCSTTADLVRWTHLLHSGQVVSASSLQQMMAPTVLLNGDTIGYGYGLGLAELAGNSKVGHGGRANGFTSSLAYYPQEDLTIAVLVNSGRGKPFEVEEALARTVLKNKLLDLPLSAADLARYEGTYTYESERRTKDLRIIEENGKLIGQLVGGGSFRLLYQGNHVFVPVVDNDDRLVFKIKDGRAEGFAHYEGRWEVTPARRKP